MFEVVVECSAGDVWGGCFEGFFGCLVLDGGGVVLGRVPDVLGGVVVGRVRRQENRGDALQQPVGLVEVGQGSGVVGAGVVRDDRGLAGAGFLLERVRCEGRLLGVLVLLGRVRRDFFAGRGRASGKDWDVFCRSTDGLVRCPLGGCMRRVQASCSGRASSAVWAFRPWSDKLLTRVVVQAMRLVVAGSLRCSSNGSGGSGFGPHRGGSSRYEESDRYSASDRVFTASRIAGTSQNPA